MKYIVILGDGMADYPVDYFDGKTILELADNRLYVGSRRAWYVQNGAGWNEAGIRCGKSFSNGI